MTQRRRLPVPEGLLGERADVALARLLGLSRTRAAELLSGGAVELDGIAIGKSTMLAGEWLDIDLTLLAEPEPIPVEVIPGLAIVYDDADLVVVDKPVGVAAHPSAGWRGPTVVGGLEAAGFRVATSGAAERQGIVQRLDVGTSGLMVVAKSERAYSVLKQAFRDREVEKTYAAVAQGSLRPPAGTVDAPIGRHPGHDYRFAVTEAGRASITHYETSESLRGATLLRVGLETGRTHQIRVHLSALGHPLVGDLTYGADPRLAAELGLNRQWLHAAQLRFAHPVTGEKLQLSSVLPPDLQAALEQLRLGAAPSVGAAT